MGLGLRGVWGLERGRWVIGRAALTRVENEERGSEGWIFRVGVCFCFCFLGGGWPSSRPGGGL